MKNLRIGVKLIGGFILTALLASTIGIVGFLGLNSTDEALEEVARVRLPSILGLGIMNEAQTAVQRSERTLLIPEIINNPRDLERQLQVVSEAWANADKGWKIYEPLPQTKEEEKLWKEFVPTWAAWKKDTAEIVELVKKGEREVAYAISLGKARESFNAAETLLGKIVDLNVAIAEDSAKVALPRADRDRIILIIISVVCVLLSLALGITLTRIITRPIFKGVDFARLLALGDTGQTLDVHQKDEIGQLADALRSVAAAEKDVAVLAGRVAAGDLSVVVTRRGNPLAKIVPVIENAPRTDRKSVV